VKVDAIGALGSVFDICPIPDPRNPRNTVWIIRRDGTEIAGHVGRRFYGTARAARMAIKDHIERQAGE
jgi:hypothetical protein